MPLNPSTHRKTGPTPIPVAERFWSKVDYHGPVPLHRPDLGPCWVWMGAIGRGGYGNFAADASRASRRSVNAHKWAYGATVGPIPGGLQVCHSCDVRKCVNPGHLFLGTRADNAADMVAKGRHRHKSHQKIQAVGVPEIRARLSEGEPRWSIAEDYGVSVGTIGYIHRNETWRHV